MTIRRFLGRNPADLERVGWCIQYTEGKTNKTCQSRMLYSEKLYFTGEKKKKKKNTNLFQADESKEVNHR